MWLQTFDIFFSLPPVDAGVPTGSTTDTSAYECDTDSCKLPDCHCASPEPPGGLSPSNTPQFVTWTSDDAMNIYTDAAVKRFLGNRQNPNGCPVKSTYCGSSMCSRLHETVSADRFGPLVFGQLSRQ